MRKYPNGQQPRTFSHYRLKKEFVVVSCPPRILTKSPAHALPQSQIDGRLDREVSEVLASAAAAAAAAAITAAGTIAAAGSGGAVACVFSGSPTRSPPNRPHTAGSSSNGGSSNGNNVSFLGGLVLTGLDMATPGGVVEQVSYSPATGDAFPTRVGPTDFDVLRVVGQGAFGKVFQVRKPEDKKQTSQRCTAGSLPVKWEGNGMTTAQFDAWLFRVQTGSGFRLKALAKSGWSAMMLKTGSACNTSMLVLCVCFSCGLIAVSSISSTCQVR